MVKTMRPPTAASGNGAHPLDQSGDASRRRYLWRRFLHSASGFWVGGGRSTAWLLSAALLSIIVLLLGAAYAMNTWNRAMFDSLQNRDAARSAGCRSSISRFWPSASC